MKIVHSWLGDLVPLPDDPALVADTLSDVGLAVDAVTRVGAVVPGVVTARVLRTERHPDAAKVQRVFVDAGDGVERHVWCGAFNMSAGDIVPLATPGTVMPDGRSIEPRPILSIASEGMLCSARELGLGDDHSGILLLGRGTTIGVPYGEALGLREEVVYDLDVTRNRPDGHGHRGVARDLAARWGTTLRPLPGRPAEDAPTRTAPVEILDGDRCGRFTTVVISGVRIVPSPDWVARRLAAAGMRAINNVVDVSNYVMLECNQPNHAYDAASVSGVRVRRARDGETLTTLDGAQRRLGVDDLLICDVADRPIGLAGIMGGLDTEIDETTTAVVLEMAWFEPLGVMRTAQAHGLRTEASLRFERGVDPWGIDGAVARFVELLRLTCPDLVVHQGSVDARSADVPVARRIPVRPHRLSALLGGRFTAEEIATLLAPIGFGSDVTADGTLTVIAPTWRPDCVAEVDVAEEVARLFGYERLGRTVPRSPIAGGLSPQQRRRRRLREVLLGLGVSEAMPHPFLGEGDLARSGLPADAVRLVNPLVVGDDVLRTSLRPGLLRAVVFNESHRTEGVALFEIGRVYPPGAGELPDEYEALAVVLAGRAAPDAVAMWREVSAAMGWGARLDQATVPAGMHPGRSATLSLGRDTVGAVGEVHPDVLDAFGISERVAVLELHLGHLLALEPRVPQWRATSRYPSADIDLAVVAADELPAERVEKAIRQGGANALVGLWLFDVYRGPGVPEGSRSLAYRLRLQVTDRTLTDTDIAAVRDKAVAAIERLGASLRA